MSYETAAIITLFGSFIGIGVILIRKIPILVELPEAVAKPLLGDFWLKHKEKIKNIFRSKSFSFETFLQKILSKIRVLSLRIDNKTFNWLQKLRERSQKKKFEGGRKDDNYWEEIKKSTKK